MSPELSKAGVVLGIGFLLVACSSQPVATAAGQGGAGDVGVGGSGLGGQGVEPGSGGQPGAGGAGGAPIDCSAVGCGVTPQCGQPCGSVCGCCPCAAGQLSGGNVCTAQGCWQPVPSDGGGAACDPATHFTCSTGYLYNNQGVCSADVVEPTCLNNSLWTCPSFSIPTSQCTARRCDADLPRGACAAGDSFTCSGYIYPFVEPVCTCVNLTWSCAL